jgi:hypothetical protein
MTTYLTVHCNSINKEENTTLRLLWYHEEIWKVASSTISHLTAVSLYISQVCLVFVSQPLVVYHHSFLIISSSINNPNQNCKCARFQSHFTTKLSSDKMQLMLSIDVIICFSRMGVNPPRAVQQNPITVTVYRRNQRKEKHHYEIIYFLDRGYLQTTRFLQKKKKKCKSLRTKYDSKMLKSYDVTMPSNQSYDNIKYTKSEYHYQWKQIKQMYCIKYRTTFMERSAPWVAVSCAANQEHTSTSQHFMDAGGSLPHPQESSTCLYPEPYQFSPYHPINFLTRRIRVKNFLCIR